MGANSGLMDFLPFILVFALIYFLMIRPQQKRAKQQQEMISALTEGSEVFTASGIMGRLTRIDESVVHVEVAPGVVVVMQKSAVTAVLPSGTLESPEQLPPPPPSCCA